MRDKWNFLHHPRLTSGGEGWNQIEITICSQLKVLMAGYLFRKVYFTISK